MKRDLSMDALRAAAGTAPPADDTTTEPHGPCRGCQQFAWLLRGHQARWTEEDVMDARVLAALIWWSELDDYEGVSDIQWEDAALQQYIGSEEWATSKHRLVKQGAVKWISGLWYVTPERNQ
jgi:hypothetical protein